MIMMVEMVRTGGRDGGKLVAVTVIMVVEMRRRKRAANVHTVQLTARPCAVLHIY